MIGARAIIVLLLFVPLTYSKALSDEIWKVSMPKMPLAVESEDKGILVDLFKAIAKEAGIKLQITVQPFKRSFQSIADGKVHMHVPFLHPEDGAMKIPGILSEFRLFSVEFNIFSLEPLDIAKLDEMIVETEAAHVPSFRQKFTPSYCLKCSLRMLSKKRIDAFIFERNVIQKLIENEKMRGIVSQLYKKFPVRVIFSKQTSREFRGNVRNAFYKVIKSGVYEKLIGPYIDRELIEELKKR